MAVHAVMPIDFLGIAQYFGRFGGIERHTLWSFIWRNDVTDPQDPEFARDPAARNGMNPMAASRPSADSRPIADDPFDVSEPDKNPAKPDKNPENNVAEKNSTSCLEQTEQLLNDHFDTVFRYAYRLTGNSSAAEDVAQEVFLRAFRNSHQLRDAGAAKGWLFVITRNEFARWCKKFAPRSSLEMLDIPDHQTAADCSAIDREEWVQQALEQLPVDYRTVIGMFYFEQLSYVEIAEELGIPIGTVMSRLNRGRAHLKKTLRHAVD